MGCLWAFKYNETLLRLFEATWVKIRYNIVVEGFPFFYWCRQVFIVSAENSYFRSECKSRYTFMKCFYASEDFQRNWSYIEIKTIFRESFKVLQVSIQQTFRWSSKELHSLKSPMNCSSIQQWLSRLSIEINCTMYLY